MLKSFILAFFGKLLPKTFVSLFGVLAVSLWAVVCTASASTLEGTYVGNVHVDEIGKRIPIQMAIALSQNAPQPTPGAPVDIQKSFNVSFVIDNEGGPYKAYNALYNINDGHFEVNYLRSSQGSMGNAATPNLRFDGHLTTDGTFEGTLFSGTTGAIGAFKLTRTNAVGSLKIKPKYVGNWVGKINYTSGSDAGTTGSFSVKLSPSPSTYINPGNYDLDYTAGKIGGFNLEGLQLGFNQVSIDYFRRKMVLTYQANARLDIFCDLLDDGSIQGAVNATYTGQTGTFHLTQQK